MLRGKAELKLVLNLSGHTKLSACGTAVPGHKKRPHTTAIRSELRICKLTKASLELSAIQTNLVCRQEIKSWSYKNRYNKDQCFTIFENVLFSLSRLKEMILWWADRTKPELKANRNPVMQCRTSFYSAMFLHWKQIIAIKSRYLSIFKGLGPSKLVLDLEFRFCCQGDKHL